MSFSDPQYRVQFYSYLNNTTFGIGPLICEPSKIKNLGWSSFLNDVPEFFVTLDQDDPQVLLLRGYLGKCHVRVLRSVAGGAWDTVWTGFGLMESDATNRDVVFYGFGYLAGLWWLHTNFNQEWLAQEVGTIVSELWTRAKTTLTQSNLGFVTTGTIQAPVTTSGGATPLILPVYNAFYKRILLVLQELATFSASDTNNGVVFEITHSNTPTFNLWKNLGQDRTSLVWELGGAVRDYRQAQMPILHRNNLLAVGAAANNDLLRYEISNAGDINDFGRRQESIFLSWVRDETEVQRVTKRRMAMALREDINLELRFRKGRVIPPGATGQTFILGDRVKVRINRGITNIDEYRLVTGVQVMFVKGQEVVRAITQQRPGS